MRWDAPAFEWQTVIFAGQVMLAIVENFLLFCMAIYSLVLVRRVCRTLAATPPSERAAQRGPLVKRTVIRFGAVYLMWWVVFSVIGYGDEVWTRSEAKDCTRSSAPEYEGKYFAEECPVRGNKDGDRILLRLYEVRTGDLVAEEFVSNPTHKLEWESGSINKMGSLRDSGTYSVRIFIPPTWPDKIRARLP